MAENINDQEDYSSHPEFISDEDVDKYDEGMESPDYSSHPEFISDEEVEQQKVVQPQEESGFVKDLKGSTEAALIGANAGLPLSQQRAGALAVAQELGQDLYENVFPSETSRPEDTKSLSDLYYEAQELKRKQEEQAAKDYPYAYYPAMVGTGLATGGAVAKGALGAANLVTKATPALAGAAEALSIPISGALTGLTEGSARTLQGDLAGTAKDVATGAALSSAVGTGAKVLGEGVEAGGKALGKVKDYVTDFALGKGERKRLLDLYQKGRSNPGIDKAALEEDFQSLENVSGELRSGIKSQLSKTGKTLEQAQAESTAKINLKPRIEEIKSRLDEVKDLVTEDEIAEYNILRTRIQNLEKLRPSGVYNAKEASALEDDLEKLYKTPFNETPLVRSERPAQTAQEIVSNVKSSIRSQWEPSITKLKDQYSTEKDIARMAGLQTDTYVGKVDAQNETDALVQKILQGGSPESAAKPYLTYKHLKKEMTKGTMKDIADKYLPEAERLKENMSLIRSTMREGGNLPGQLGAQTPVGIVRSRIGTLAHDVGRLSKTLDTSDATWAKLLRATKPNTPLHELVSLGMSKPESRKRALYLMQSSPVYRNQLSQLEEEPKE